jgi:YidC/Oxa1 family membrane protein insertase
VDDKRNMILAMVLALVILLGWPFVSEKFFPAPPPPPQAAAPAAQATPAATAAPNAANTSQPVRPLEAVLPTVPRVAIETPRLQGSISLKGARVDDLLMTGYRQTIEKGSPAVRLFSPEGTKDAYFAGFGWSGQGFVVPNGETLWTADGSKLTPETPVTLRWDNGQGQRFRIRLSIDQNYMLSAQQTVENVGGAPIVVSAYNYLVHVGPSQDPSTWTIHTGPIGVFNGAANYDINFANLDGNEPGFFAQMFGTKAVAGMNRYQTNGGWIGFTDHYWHAALVPAQDKAVTATFQEARNERYQADVSYTPVTVGANKAVTHNSQLFAGAKETAVLDAYTDAGIPLFDRAIDWGWFRWFEKPIFYLLDWLFKAIGNFGVAIICLTFIVRGIMFPIAQRQFASMAAMRAIQPKMKALQEKYKNDKPKAQQAIMELYRQEKVNPLAGCLPIFLQIPIFFALYKVLMLTIEMRHQPFFLWIKDLSAPDPLHVLNLFGLLDFTPPSFLAIGLLAIILGITMWLQFKLNPAPMDEMQKQIFAIMPWMMMFVMAPFAAGLLIYWCTSNILTIAQQWWLYRQHPALKEPVAK